MQPTVLFALPEPTFRVEAVQFDGTTIEPVQDNKRLTGQTQRVFEAMKDGHYRTLEEIRAIAGGSTPGVSARLRDLRKARFGGYVVDRRARGERSRGLFEYRLIVPLPLE